MKKLFSNATVYFTEQEIIMKKLFSNATVYFTEQEIIMKKLFSNATVYFTEQEIIERECLQAQCVQIVKNSFVSLNKAVQFQRIETPILTPPEYLQGHVECEFPMIKANENYLRPEIAGGCFVAFRDMFPQNEMLMKQLPYCIWQVGKSFREEHTSNTMRASRLRLREFWQLEFELIVSDNTKANYIEAAIDSLISRFVGEKIISQELPHYSLSTLDWEISGIEIAGCSIRKDFGSGCLVHEVSIGLDRLLNMVI